MATTLPRVIVCVLLELAAEAFSTLHILSYAAYSGLMLLAERIDNAD